MASFLMFSAQMPYAPWAAASEGMGRREDGPDGPVRIDVARLSHLCSRLLARLVRERRQAQRTAHSGVLRPQSNLLTWARTALGAAGESAKASGYG
jgi:hypothetical protein